MKYRWYLFGMMWTAFWLYGLHSLAAQRSYVPDSLLRDRIVRYKADLRGPYKDIRWFCTDGSFAIPRRETCPAPGGVQRARYKDEVAAWGEQEHLFIGQILSTTDRVAFWDEPNYQSRLKQYLLEKYLRAVDDGWVLRRARYYRGASQIEDEEAWGYDFLVWALSDRDRVERYFYLLREAVREVPHRADDRQTQQLRALSKYIADRYPPFGDLRVKLHGLPESGDVRRVADFIAEHRNRLDPALSDQLEALLQGLEEQYKPPDIAVIRSYLDRIPTSVGIREAVQAFVSNFGRPATGSARAVASAELLWQLREALSGTADGEVRLALFDLSLDLEEWYRMALEEWDDNDLSARMNKVCHGAMAAAGTGLLEAWEWRAVEGDLAVPLRDSISLQELREFQQQAARITRWGAAQVQAVFREEVRLFSGFEPLAEGFADDRIRSSVLLALGRETDMLGRRIALATGAPPALMDGQVQGTVRGLHPGFAKGKLVVVESTDYSGGMDKDKIYCFRRPPTHLQPVAGLAAVEAGNLVSHIQLLARNLGIPLAELSQDAFDALRRFDGQEVFLAVTPMGKVVLKQVADMTEAERQLFHAPERIRRLVEVPTDKLDLSIRSLLSLRAIGASASGRTCGPKAANLGELKRLFPEQVVEGLVIPFGIFREHMDQLMPGTDGSYWDYLQETFTRRESRAAEGRPAAQTDSLILTRLARLRAAIRTMELRPAFTDSLRRAFGETLGKEWGRLPVFLRSDTNMEDLEAFTGAGLNLTVFNVVDGAEILQGIRDVWASPFSERSYRWRQLYLSNPSQVYPSILIVPSVDVDYSGVMVTTGLSGGQADDLTIAFSRGAGGAVEGQLAESYRIHADGVVELLAPAREPVYRRLPETGGSAKAYTSFHRPMVTQGDIHALRNLAAVLAHKFPGMHPPFDVECGFRNGRLWLFQVRPYVETTPSASWLSGADTPDSRIDRLLPMTGEGSDPASGS